MTLRAAFVDFFRTFDPEQSVLVEALRTGRSVELVDAAEADLLVFNDWGHRHRSFAGTKVHYTAENVRPRWSQADFCIGFERTPGPRYLRVPHFGQVEFLRSRRGVEIPPGPAWAERDFCNFVYSHRATRMRGELFRAVNQYRPVTSPGRFRNNASAPELSGRYDGAWRETKLLYQRRFRFTIACEGASYPGYTTEKLYDALVAGTIPIYWGNPYAREDVDERAFVDCHSCRNLGEVVDVVRRIDQDPELAAQYLARRDFLITPLEEHFAQLVAFFDRVVEYEAPRREAERRARRLQLQGVGRGTASRAYAWATHKQRNPGDWRSIFR